MPSPRACAAVAMLALGLAAQGASAAVRTPTGFFNDVIVEHLVEPNSVALLPDLRAFVTEQRSGRIRLIVSGIQPRTSVTVSDVEASGYEQGLQGIAVDPGWPERPYVYVFFNRVGGHLQVNRYTGFGSLQDPQSNQLYLINPVVIFSELRDDLPEHNGGCLRFGGDGHLYLSLGDDGTQCTASDPGSLRGCILRIRVNDIPEQVEGTVPRDLITPNDNPFAASPDSNTRLVWAYGLRNPWRFHIDPITGHVFVADVGLVTVEELNEVFPGDFLGWPYREGPVVRNPPGCPEPGGPGTNAFKEPIVAMFRQELEVASISSGGVYRTPPGGVYGWPSAYDGDVFYGEYYTGTLQRLRRSPEGAYALAPSVPGQPDSLCWATGLISAVDFTVGPDGSLWWLAQYDSTRFGETGSLNRIRFDATSVLAVHGLVPDALNLRSAPNPFSRRVALSFHLAAAAAADVEVFDVMGRRIRTLWDGPLPAGENRLTWDGIDAAGRQARPGIYLARLRTSTHQSTVRLLRVE